MSFAADVQSGSWTLGSARLGSDKHSIQEQLVLGNGCLHSALNFGVTQWAEVTVTQT